MTNDILYLEDVTEMSLADGQNLGVQLTKSNQGEIMPTSLQLAHQDLKT